MVIKSFSSYTGIYCMMLGGVFFVVISIFAIANNFGFIPSFQFRGIEFYDLQSWVHFFYIAFVLIPIVFGIICFIVGKVGYLKLKKLKRIGEACIPDKTRVLMGMSFYATSYHDGTYATFRVRCVFVDANGEKIAVKSRRLVVCEGWLKIVPQNAQILCEATVYKNPKKSNDYVVDVVLL